MTGKVRIIGGRWKRSRLPVPDVKGLRPTPDRVRETLFNWLQTKLPGARCLDLFAGTGALGLEAASRGASQVLLVDNDPQVVQHLRAQVQRLGADHVVVQETNASTLLGRPAEPFDIVFLDPPFASGMLTSLCRSLEERGWLSVGGLVYLEGERSAPDLVLPGNWVLDHVKVAGRVRYALARKLHQEPD